MTSPVEHTLHSRICLVVGGDIFYQVNEAQTTQPQTWRQQAASLATRNTVHMPIQALATPVLCTALCLLSCMRLIPAHTLLVLTMYYVLSTTRTEKGASWRDAHMSSGIARPILGPLSRAQFYFLHPPSQTWDVAVLCKCHRVSHIVPSTSTETDPTRFYMSETSVTWADRRRPGESIS